VHGQCPDPGARRLLAENLYEEETGGLSRTGPHPDLFMKMMRGLGFGRVRFDRASLLPCAERYRRWLDLVTTRGGWVIGAAVITIFVEGSVNDRAVLSNRRRHNGPYLARRDPLAVHHGVHDSFLTLKHAHAKVENGHREAAWRIVETHAIGLQARKRLIGAMRKSLRLWLDYRDGVARAAGLVPGAAVR
jgi:pyrroloquinoline-quinone synthase